MNANSDEITFTKFNCKLKFGKSGCIAYPADRRD
jgi:hypothetical protein